MIDRLGKIEGIYQHDGDIDEVAPLWDEAMGFLMAKRQFEPRENHQALVFEYLSGMRVREEQAVIIQNVLKQNSSRPMKLTLKSLKFLMMIRPSFSIRVGRLVFLKELSLLTETSVPT